MSNELVKNEVTETAGLSSDPTDDSCTLEYVEIVPLSRDTVDPGTTECDSASWPKSERIPLTGVTGGQCTTESGNGSVANSTKVTETAVDDSCKLAGDTDEMCVSESGSGTSAVSPRITDVVSLLTDYSCKREHPESVPIAKDTNDASIGYDTADWSEVIPCIRNASGTCTTESDYSKSSVFAEITESIYISSDESSEDEDTEIVPVAKVADVACTTVCDSAYSSFIRDDIGPSTTTVSDNRKFCNPAQNTESVNLLVDDFHRNSDVVSVTGDTVDSSTMECDSKDGSANVKLESLSVKQEPDHVLVC